MQFFFGILKGKHILVSTDKVIIISLKIFDKIELVIFSSQ